MLRHHLSRKKIAKLRPVAQTGRMFGWKPEGFWFEVDGGWREWCEAEQWGSKVEECWLYRVELNGERILQLSTPEQLDDFTVKYTVGLETPRNIQIDWATVAEQYDGIEIAPYIGSRRHTYMWYYGWDCASGCLWRPRGAQLHLESSPQRKGAAMTWRNTLGANLRHMTPEQIRNSLHRIRQSGPHLCHTEIERLTGLTRTNQETTRQVVLALVERLVNEPRPTDHTEQQP